jgi:hypothetical protein
VACRRGERLWAGSLLGGDGIDHEAANARESRLR